MFQTEFDFTLPCGYLDASGTLHREGTMRRATAADEILPLKDPRVVTRLGGVEQVNTKVIEDLYATDLAYLQQLYNRVNSLEDAAPQTVCPSCSNKFVPQAVGLGG